MWRSNSATSIKVSYIDTSVASWARRPARPRARFRDSDVARSLRTQLVQHDGVSLAVLDDRHAADGGGDDVRFERDSLGLELRDQRVQVFDLERDTRSTTAP